MSSFNLFLSNFHFVRPYWLLAIFALLLVLKLLKKHRFYQSPWQQFLPSHLSQVLLEGTSSTDANKKMMGEQAFLIKPLLIGLLSIIALAGPAWQKLPQPVYQTERGSVLIMDMSYSMYSTDIKPNRLTRARFKAIDLLNKINEGDIGLVAYAGDAFIISPLTQDIKNIELLLPSLTPEIMPELGANPLAALTLAHEMLLNAGHLNGDIYWFTDDVDNEELTDIYDWSNEFGHQLNILGIGSENGAPITLPSGELLKDNRGAIVVPRLPSQKLKSLASRGHGNYQTISNDDSDIDNLILKDKLSERNKKQQSQQSGDQWQEQGAWLLLLVLPLMLSYFRRGSTLLMLPLSCAPLLFLLSFSVVSPTSFSAESTSSLASTSKTSTSNNLWQNLWQTNDQQAQKQYNQENYQGAAEQFDNSQWQGSAHYKAGNYQKALDAYKEGEQATSANSLYNQGNALAQMQQYEKAIESYEQALTKNPDLQDAKDNIEKIKQQQKEQEQKKEQQQGDQSQDKDNQEKDQQQDSQSQDEQSQDQQSKQNQQQSEDSQQQQKDSESEPQQSDKEQKNKSEDSNKEQKNKETEQKQQDQINAEQTDKKNEQGEEKTTAQIAAEQQAKETEQKHQQLLNKVTDDPYLLLRNKMQLEYQKRKQDGASQGVKKKW